ncbi:hypothetical protein FRB98_002647, partial [Tulasnella sp. 332]
LRYIKENVSRRLHHKTKGSSNRSENTSPASGEPAEVARPVDPDERQGSASDSPPDVLTPDSSSAIPNRV